MISVPASEGRGQLSKTFGTFNYFCHWAKTKIETKTKVRSCRAPCFQGRVPPSTSELRESVDSRWPESGLGGLGRQLSRWTPQARGQGTFCTHTEKHGEGLSCPIKTGAQRQLSTFSKLRFRGEGERSLGHTLWLLPRGQRFSPAEKNKHKYLDTVRYAKYRDG